MEEGAEIEATGGFPVRVLQGCGLQDKESFSRQRKKEGHSREEKPLFGKTVGVQKIRSPLMCLKDGCRGRGDGEESWSKVRTGRALHVMLGSWQSSDGRG